MKRGNKNITMERKLYEDGEYECLEIYENDIIVSRGFYIKKVVSKNVSTSLLHNENDTPAWIDFYPNGNVKLEVFYNENEINNTRGPAIVKYNKENKIIKELYYINGIKLEKPELHIRKYKILKSARN